MESCAQKELLLHEGIIWHQSLSLNEANIYGRHLTIFQAQIALGIHEHQGWDLQVASLDAKSHAQQWQETRR